MVGKKLSHYKILAELGRGGMGIVYKAEDTKLDRTVAIKVLPSATLGNEDDRARFYREAKAAAQLHHPHIASVFEIDEAVPEGSGEDDIRPFIAMEFIEGDTLEERIKQGPLKIGDCVRIAGEIASGLKAAHDKEIVHRDIKAANVILDKNGGAKILDFGLAQTSNSTRLTRMGSTLGTVAFMSPEQARGEEVDQRSDLWSLGVVLYEMVAGRSPFPGDYEQAVVYEILNQDPEPLTAVRTGVPMELEAIVAKCLAKDTALRYPSAEGLIVDLKRIDAGSAIRTSQISSRVSMAAAEPIAVAAAPTAKQSLALPLAIGAAALVIGLLLGFMFFQSNPPPRPVIKAQLSLPNAVSPLQAVVTPDDKQLFYVISDPADAKRKISVYNFETGERTIIPRTEDAWRPAISPDGRWVAFQNAGTGGWWRLPTSGGEPVRIPNSESRTGGGAMFSVDGDLLVSDSTWSVTRIQTGGAREIAMSSDRDEGFMILTGQKLSPSGAFWTVSNWIAPFTPQQSWIVKEGSEPEILLDGAFIHAFTSSGHALFMRGNNSVPSQTIAVPIDLDTGELLGDEVALGVRSVQPAISPSGMMVYEELSVESLQSIPSQLYRVLPSGASEFLFTLPGASSQEIAVSSDGSKMVVNAGADIGGVSDMYLLDLQNGTPTRLTQDGGYDVPTFGGGDDILYFDFRVDAATNEWTIMSRRADGSGTNELVLPDGGSGGDPDVTSDNTLMVFSGSDDNIWGFDMVADTVWTIVENETALYKPDASPDGSYLVFLHDSDAYCGSMQVVTVRGNSEPIELVANACYPVWTHDGNYIYFQDAQSISRIPVTTDPVFRQLGPIEEIYTSANSRPVGTAGSLFYDVSADGTLFVAHSQVGEAGSNPIWVVTNWFEELNRIAPRSD